MKALVIPGDFCLFFASCLFTTITGHVLHRNPAGRLYAFEGKDVALPCGLGAPLSLSQVTAVEWLRVDGPSPQSVHVLRLSEDLVKDHAQDYLGRTTILKNGSLKLVGVRQQDTGIYKCVLLTGSALEKEAIVSLLVVQGPEVNFLLWRTAANQLFVLCKSSGWNPKPLLSILDWRRSRVPTMVEPEVSVQPDGLFSVSMRVNMEAVHGPGNKSVICQMEVPDQHLIIERMIPITDDYVPSDERPGWIPESIVGIVGVVELCVIIGAAIRYFAPDWRTNTYESLTEYGRTGQLTTDGASEDTCKASGLRVRGTEASNILAARDLEKMRKYKDSITRVGKKLAVEPALIAAIISRQSEAGTKLSPSGYGQTDPNCFGLMQINRHYHAIKGSAYSGEHIDQGVTFLIQLIKTMRRVRPAWTQEQQLKGALACYIAGEDKVIPLSYEELDSVTPNKDFASDVVARAHWFARNGF
ncbi:uncharacterized protein LOC130522554 isoform X1 [Takifugu flavidus]|uniref:uncharacterized protein LOC130522554 isoform X1 n=1 Tax=Takifugu flavidus TaxID=433684 RepID=UPI002544CE2D|nr:uncharacterized protein LOC130522554 isoform X1 [Takifugu flavidus]